MASNASYVLRYDEASGTGPLDVVGAVRLTNGVTVVASAQSTRLEFYAATGTLVRTIGRRGKGPGEFGALAALWRTGDDSLITFEGGLTRTFALFDSSGRFARTWTSMGGDSSTRYLIPLAALPDGRVAARTMNVISPLPVAQTTRPLTSILLFSRDWSDPQHLFRLPDTYRFQGPGDLQSEVPFTPEPLAAFSRSAGFFAQSDSSVVHVRRFGDRSLAMIRWSEDRRAVTSQDVEQELARRVNEANTLYSNAPALRRRFVDGALRPMFRQMSLPTSLPLVGRLLVDSEGLLWVLSYVTPAERFVASRTARIFDASGNMVDRIELRAGFEPTQIGPDFVLGIRTDADGVTSVESYVLTRGSTTSSP